MGILQSMQLHPYCNFIARFGLFKEKAEKQPIIETFESHRNNLESFMALVYNYRFGYRVYKV